MATDVHPELEFLAGGGEMGALMRAKDWSPTLLGPVAKWPQSLRTMIGTCLNSRFPMVVWWGRDLVNLYNDAYRQVLGAKHPAALGKPVREVWAEIWNIIGPMLEGVFLLGEATWSENTMFPLERKGFVEECYFTFSYSPIRDESGGIGGIFTAVTETTEQVLSTRRLLLLSELATRTSGIADERALCEAAMGVLEQNNSDIGFAQLCLLCKDRMTCFTTASTPGAAFDDALIAEVARTGIASQLQTSLGSVLGLAIATPGATEAAGVLVVGLNPRLELDEAYRRFLGLVASQLATALASARAFEEARRRAESLAELDRSKTTFFSNVSHEFRTPLTLMLAPIQDMLAMPEGARIDRPAVELLHRNALRLHKLVNTLLEFSRIEAGRIEAVYEPMDLSILTAELGSSFRAAIERAGLQLVVECLPLPEPAHVDRDMWEKIVLNLLSNAFKYTFEGSIALRLRAVGDSLSLEVADTGTGIAEAELPRLFERFHRVEGARARSHEGSGIGLALTQELVRLHGGAVHVSSRLGSGTTFEVRIPRGSLHLPQDRLRATRTIRSTALGVEAFVAEASRWVPAEEEASPQPSSRAGESKVHILIADDNADMRDYLVRLLGERWAVESVGDGAAALASARRSPPDLLLCDVMMPNLDGFALARAIRADAALSALPIIMLSARAGAEESSKGLSAGANDYIAKPFAARDLVVRVASVLAASRSAKERLALEESQRSRLQRLFEHAPVGIAVLRGPEHVFEVANSQYIEFVSGRQVLQKSIREALPELAGQGIYELLDQVYETGKPYLGRSIPLMLVSPQGHPEERFFDFVYQPIPGDDGKPESIMVVTFEVSELARARGVAETANRAKDEFFAILGHELRNPLAPITTALQLMKLRGVQGGEKERAIIERQVSHLGRLVEDLLDVSRIALGKVELRREVMDIAEVLAKAVESASPLLEKRRHQLRLDLPRGNLFVDGDAVRLAQVFGNLLINSAKYTDEGGDISVHARRDGPELVLEVSDNGIGMEPGLLAQVFELFVQEQQGTARSRGGLGLGLAIVRSIVKLHGGSVSAASRGTGKGSTFTVRLPATEVHAAGQENPQPPLLAPDLPRAASKIIVVDDSIDGADLLAESLSLLGYEVRVAHDGPTALQAVSDFTPDVAILDIGLPGMDGYELASRLRALPALWRTALVALTGYGQEGDRSRSKSAGFDEHLVKPVELRQLEVTIASVLAERSTS